jgi:protein-disulfide isomerase
MRLSKILLLAVLILVIASLTWAQEATPLSPVDLGETTGLPQSVSAEGYPQIGNAEARVPITVYCSFDSPDCAAYYREIFPALLPRISAGEVLYTFVPLPELNGRSAARAALCGAEQAKFWPLAVALYEAQAAQGVAALEAANLMAIVDQSGVDRALWDSCMLSLRPDDLLDDSVLYMEAQPGFTDTVPFIVVNGVPNFSDLNSLNAAIDLELSQPLPTEDPEAPIVVTIEPLTGQRAEPPLVVSLPHGWRQGYDVLLLNDVDSNITSVPLAVYTGPVTGGEATIVLFWGFPNFVQGNPFTSSSIEPDLWVDGLRLLRLAVVEQGCNVGTDLRREYTIGALTAVGTQFSAVDCPELPDTRGWFAGVRERNINFVFFVFTDPIDAMNSAQGELQAILDTIQFQFPPEVTPTPAP